MEQLNWPYDLENTQLEPDPTSELSIASREQIWGLEALFSLKNAYKCKSLAESQRTSELSLLHDSDEKRQLYLKLADGWELRAKAALARAIAIDVDYTPPGEEDKAKIEIIEPEEERELNNVFSNFKHRYTSKTIGLAKKNIEKGNEQVVINYSQQESLPELLISGIGEVALDHDPLKSQIPHDLNVALIKYTDRLRLTKPGDSLISHDHETIKIRRAKYVAANLQAALMANSIKNSARNASEVTNGHGRRQIGVKGQSSPYQELRSVFMRDNNLEHFEAFVDVCLCNALTAPDLIREYELMDEPLPKGVYEDPSKFVRYFKSHFFRMKKNKASVALQTKLEEFLKKR